MKFLILIFSTSLLLSAVLSQDISNEDALKKPDSSPTQTQSETDSNQEIQAPDIGISVSNLESLSIEQDENQQKRQLDNYAPDYSSRIIQVTGVSSISGDPALSACYYANVTYTGEKTENFFYTSAVTHSIYTTDSSLSAKADTEVKNKAGEVKASINAMFEYSSSYSEETKSIDQDVFYTYKFKSPRYTNFTLTPYGTSVFGSGDAINASVNCGDLVVTSHDVNITIQLSIKYSFESTEQKNSWKAAASVQIPAGPVDVTVGVEIGGSIFKGNYKGRIQMRASQVGGQPLAFIKYLADNFQISNAIECTFDDSKNCNQIFLAVKSYASDNAFRSQIDGYTFLPISENTYPGIVTNVSTQIYPGFNSLDRTEFNSLLDRLKNNRAMLRAELSQATSDLELLTDFYKSMIQKTDTCGNGVKYSMQIMVKMYDAITKINKRITFLTDSFFGIPSCYTTDIAKCDYLVASRYSQNAYSASDLILYDDMCVPLKRLCSFQDLNDQDAGVSISTELIKDDYFSNYSSKLASKNGNCTFACSDSVDPCFSEKLKSMTIVKILVFITLVIILV